MESPIITKSIFLLFASLSFSLWSLGMNFLSGDGTGMTVEGESQRIAPPSGSLETTRQWILLFSYMSPSKF